MKSFVVESIPSNILPDNCVESRMMATLIKLLVIKIVASNPFGVSNNSSIVTADLFESSRIASLSKGVKEKNATSAPETSAEQNNKISNTPIDIENGTQLISARMGKKVCSKLSVFV